MTATTAPSAATAAGVADAWRRTALILLVCLLAFLPGFAALPVTDRDEGRFAQATKQMLESGDFVDIRFQDEARHKKPIGIHWLQSASVSAVSALTGDPEPGIWAYRIPSAVGAAGAAVATGFAGAALFGPAVGTAAGVMTAAALVVGVEARIAKTDAMLLLTIAVAQALLALAYVRRDGPRPLGLDGAMAFWAAIGAGVLVKGPIILLVVGGTVLALVAVERRARWLEVLRPALGVPLALAIVLPWLVAIGIVSGGSFFEDSLGGDLFGKVAGEQTAHVAWPGYYVLSHPLTFFPFAALTVLALPWVWRNRREPAVRFCLAWIVPTWIVFEATPVKLLHYVMPVFPAVAMLAAAALFAGYGRPDGRPGQALSAAAAVVGLLPALALGGFFAVAPAVFLGAEVDPVAVAAWIAVAAAVAAGLWLVRAARPAPALAALSLGGLLLYATAYQRVLPATDPLWVSREAAEAADAAAAGLACDRPRIVTAGYSEPSLVFLTDTDTYLARLGEPAALALAQVGGCGVALVEEDQLAAFHTYLEGLGHAAFGHAIVGGFNYARGREVWVHVFTLDPSGPAAEPPGDGAGSGG
jgi:4-amino-4-deoxy-L-arabinose transferase-like glycosyltransferase